MAADIISGKEVSADVRAAVKAAVETLPGQPTLAVVLVGEDPASQVYVRNKVRQTEACGMRSLHHHLPADATQAQVETLIAELNGDDDVDGILLQLPLPKGLDEAAAIVAEPLAAMGKSLEVHRVHVANRQDAIAHELVASPSIRLNGIDIDPAVTQGECGSCGDIAGGTTTVNCRTWRWGGETHSAAPTGLIVHAILAEATRTAQPSPSCADTEAEKEGRARYTLPQNLDRFFQARDAGESRCC